jgi:eukaryotic-like serine/threonine-protein kinase
MSDSSPPVQGLVAGKYQILGLIGRGGMGSVWEGRHTNLGTRVAIKFIDPEYAESEEACARFVTEARAAATIQSKYAIQIFDNGVTDGRPYIVMELLVGEPLDKRLDRLGRLTLQETARIIGHVSRALQRAHDAGIIHRDLKPENVFLVRSPDDDEEIAKVLDFGIAKIKGPPGQEGLSSSTKTGAVLGTPYYMSPEQARGLRNIDHRSDLWSLGVIAHKCVTGVLPFEGESVGDLLVKICTAPCPTPSLTAPGLPATFDAWFAKALEREPARRFARALELADALAFAAGLSTRNANSSQDVGRPLLPTPPAPAMSPPAPTLAATAAITSAPFTAAAIPQKSSRGVLLAVVAVGVLVGSIGVAAVMKLASPRRDEGAPAASAMAATSPGATASAVVPSPSAHVVAAAAPSAESSASAAITAPPASAKSAPPAPTAVTGVPVRPKPVVAPAPPPTAATPAPAPKPVPKPSPNQADPGY